MTEDAEGAPDGINKQTFEKGKTYDLPYYLGRTFVKKGVAKDVGKAPATPSPDERETKPETSVEDREMKPEGGDAEEKTITKESTADGSPYYQFRDPNGDLITETDDGEERVVKVLGQENAEKRRKEFEESLTDDAD